MKIDGVIRYFIFGAGRIAPAAAAAAQLRCGGSLCKKSVKQA